MPGVVNQGHRAWGEQPPLSTTYQAGKPGRELSKWLVQEKEKLIPVMVVLVTL